MKPEKDSAKPIYKSIAIISNHAGFSSQSVMGLYTIILAKELCRLGFKINYYCWAVFLDTQDLPPNLTIICYPKAVFWKNTLAHLKQQNTKLLLYNYLASVSGKLGMPFIAPYYIFKLKQHGIKVITNFHETVVRWSFQKPWLTLQAIIQRGAAILILKSSCAATSSIQRYVNYLVRYNPFVNIIPIGATVFPSANYVLNLNTSLPFRIACFGNRDYTVLLQVLTTLPKSDYTIQVIIIGQISPTHKAQMQQYITTHNLSDRVVFTGLLNDTELSAALSSCHMAFSNEPVNYKGRGGASFKSTSLLAAFAFGLPIASTLGDMNDPDFTTSVPIYLIKAGETEKLKSFLLTLYHHPLRRQTIAANTLAYYHKNLSWPIIANSYASLLDKYLD
jgi:glycosyltransferase involved in cell wall biosynthesis